MKKLTTLAVIFFSCTKNDIKPPQIISGNVKQVIDVPNFSYSTSADWDLTTTQKVTYNHSPIVVYEIKSAYDRNKSLVLFSLNSKFIEAVAKTNLLPNDFKEWKLSSTSGAEYFSFQLNKENKIGKLRVVNDIPFYKFRVSSPILADAIPIDNISDSTDGIKFGKCMNETVGMCSSSWTCSFACGFLIAPCATGMALSCFAHWWDSNNRR